MSKYRGCLIKWVKLEWKPASTWHSVAEFEKPLISMLGYFSNSWISPTQSQISQSLECSLLVLPIGVCVCLSCDELVTYPGCIPCLCTMCVIGSSGSLSHCLCTWWWVDIRIRLFVFLPSAFLRSSYISLIVLPVRSTSPRPVLSSKNAADIQRKRSSPLRHTTECLPCWDADSPVNPPPRFQVNHGGWQEVVPPSGSKVIEPTQLTAISRVECQSRRQCLLAALCHAAWRHAAFYISNSWFRRLWSMRGQLCRVYGQKRYSTCFFFCIQQGR